MRSAILALAVLLVVVAGPSKALAQDVPMPSLEGMRIVNNLIGACENATEKGTVIVLGLDSPSADSKTYWPEIFAAYLQGETKPFLILKVHDVNNPHLTFTAYVSYDRDGIVDEVVEDVDAEGLLCDVVADLEIN